MRFKKERLGPRLVRAARSGERNRDAHMFLGGTGAVGGTAVLQMLSMYEDMFAVEPPSSDDVPVLVATGTTSDEIEAFTRRLFRFSESRGASGDLLPQRIRNGYLTSSGVFVALERFVVAALPELKRVAQTPPDERAPVVASFVESLGASLEDEPETVFKALSEAVASARPFSAFLEEYLRTHLAPRGVERFRSVMVGIPIPSLITYHQDELRMAVEHVPGLGQEHVEELRERFVVALRDDLAHVRTELADAVLMAHTTGVGGMYDDDPDGGEPVIRMGFAHAGLDRRMADKARFANKLTELYSKAGVKVLITAAAIGIDEVRVREQIPLHRQIRQKLFEAPAEVFPRSKGSQPATSRASRGAGRPVPARQSLRSFRPLTVPLDEPEPAPARFDRGEPIVPSFAIRSGENGFFSVGDADSLYRVMRVASASELGLMLATVALLGDDRVSPWFRDNVCYYTETDNSRQALDFLSQPALLASQLSGLDPMSLQDLGSAKHQAEMHALGLLILLHRLRTLDVAAIEPYVDLVRFDPRRFFVERSRRLTFEDIAGWDFDTLAEDIQVLAAAEEPEDLRPLTPAREMGPFPQRKEALREVLAEVLRAVWFGPSLGSPLVVEQEGRAVLRTGYYVAPLDLLVTDATSVIEELRRLHTEGGGNLEDVRDYHLSVGGFVDLRPHAIVCTAKTDREDLTGKVFRTRDLEELRGHLRTLEPYSFFSTAGLLALFLRLRSLSATLRESMLELGTLQEFRWHMPRDAAGHILVVPGVVEAFRMVSEGLEKTTGTERLDGIWGYERRSLPDRRASIPGVTEPR